MFMTCSREEKGNLSTNCQGTVWTDHINIWWSCWIRNLAIGPFSPVLFTLTVRGSLRSQAVRPTALLTGTGWRLKLEHSACEGCTLSLSYGFSLFSVNQSFEQLQWTIKVSSDRTNKLSSNTGAPAPILPNPMLYLSDHGTSIIDELSQHHGNVVINSGRMICPLSRIAYKGAKGKDCSTANLKKKHK